MDSSNRHYSNTNNNPRMSNGSGSVSHSPLPILRSLPVTTAMTTAIHGGEKSTKNSSVPREFTTMTGSSTLQAPKYIGHSHKHQYILSPEPQGIGSRSESQLPLIRALFVPQLGIFGVWHVGKRTMYYQKVTLITHLNGIYKYIYLHFTFVFLFSGNISQPATAPNSLPSSCASSPTPERHQSANVPSRSPLVCIHRYKYFGFLFPPFYT